MEPSIYKGAGIYKTGDGGGTPPTPPPEPDPDLYQVGNAFKCTSDFKFYVSPDDTRTEINKDDAIIAKYWTNQKHISSALTITIIGCNRTGSTSLYRKVTIDDNITSFYLRTQNGGTTDNQYRVSSPLIYPLEVKQQGNKTIVGGIEKNTTQTGTSTTWLRFLYENVYTGFESILYPLTIEDDNGNEKYKFYPVIRKQDSAYGFFEPHIGIFIPYLTSQGSIDLI